MRERYFVCSRLGKRSSENLTLHCCRTYREKDVSTSRRLLMMSKTTADIRWLLRAPCCVLLHSVASIALGWEASCLHHGPRLFASNTLFWSVHMPWIFSIARSILCDPWWDCPALRQSKVSVPKSSGIPLHVSPMAPQVYCYGVRKRSLCHIQWWA